MSEDRNGESDRPATERAEELVDRLLQEAGHLLSVAAVNLLKGASLAREETEDIWAEAQNLHRERQNAEPERHGGDAVAIAATDAARRRAAKLGVDLREVAGTGAGGRITVRDIERKATRARP
jgi:pyruvate/2-oxoglutarate dehydrogenase complex dihydrolipoamide acyltransferase (E2) component